MLDNLYFKQYSCLSSTNKMPAMVFFNLGVQEIVMVTKKWSGNRVDDVSSKKRPKKTIFFATNLLPSPLLHNDKGGVPKEMTFFRPRSRFLFAYDIEGLIEDGCPFRYNFLRWCFNENFLGDEHIIVRRKCDHSTLLQPRSENYFKLRKIWQKNFVKLAWILN